MKLNKIANVFIFLLILFGIFLRFYNLDNSTQFDFDQENLIAYPAKDILVDHNLPLIGGKASVGDLYIGPFYSYLAAIAFFLSKMDPIGGAYLGTVISTITIMVGFFAIWKLFNLRTAIFYTLIWSTTTMVVYFDRIPWNVNLFPLASLLVYLGLLYLKLKNNNIGWLLVGIGIFLAVNSHPASIFLFSGLVLFVLLNRKVITRFSLITVFFIFLAFLPLIVFNLRYNISFFDNFASFFKGNLQLLNLKDKVSSIALVQVSTFARLIFYDAPITLQFSLGLILIIGLFLAKNQLIKKYRQPFILFNITYFIFFITYKGQITDYYFLGLLPLFNIGLSLLFVNIERKFNLFLPLVTVFFLFVSWQSYKFVSQTHPNGLKVKKQIVKAIKQRAGDNKIAVIYDMDRGLDVGYDYLYYYYKVRVVPREETKDIFWVSFPSKRFPTKPDFVAGEIALGYPQTAELILTTKDVNLYNNLLRLRVPKHWMVLDCPYKELDKYLLTANLSASCTTFVNEVGLAIYNTDDCDRDDKPITTIPLEFKRCILIYDQNNPSAKILTPETSAVINSLKI